MIYPLCPSVPPVGIDQYSVSQGWYWWFVMKETDKKIFVLKIILSKFRITNDGL